MRLGCRTGTWQLRIRMRLRMTVSPSFTQPEYILICVLTALNGRLPQIEQVFKKAYALSEELNQVGGIVNPC
jgi:hypothetical protein